MAYGDCSFEFNAINEWAMKVCVGRLGHLSEPEPLEEALGIHILAQAAGPDFRGCEAFPWFRVARKDDRLKTSGNPYQNQCKRIPNPF